MKNHTFIMGKVHFETDGFFKSHFTHLLWIKKVHFIMKNHTFINVTLLLWVARYR